MRAIVRKWGNSGAIRIPSALLRAANLRVDQPVELLEESGRILIEPASRMEFRLADLLRGITRTNRHKEADWGRRVGHEVW